MWNRDIEMIAKKLPNIEEKSLRFSSQYPRK